MDSESSKNDRTKLLEDCQSLIKKDLESWKSYFTKWEIFAKYEESIPESELLNEPFDRVKSVKKKKVKRPSIKKRLKKVSSLTYQKSSEDHKKKNFTMTKVPRKSITENKITKKCRNFKPESIVTDPMINQMEIILKSVFLKFLRANINNLEMFDVLSQTFSNKERIDSNQLFSQCQQALSYDKLQLNKRGCLIMNQHTSPSATLSMNTHNMTVCPTRDTYIQNLRSLNFFDFNTKSVIDNKKLNRTGNLILGSTFPKFKFNCKSDENQKHFLVSVPNFTAPQKIIQTNSCIKTFDPACFDEPNYKDTKLKPFKLNLSHKSSTSVFRKINKEYFIKKAFPKMNIIQNEKRFKNLCLHERTNSVSLSLENSNFVTPERKPSERKCFSENILQRKRGHPSKLFFDNEKEDSESDDLNQNQTSLIYYKNKIKSQVIPKFVDSESDSDDCESIFDRIKKL